MKTLLYLVVLLFPVCCVAQEVKKGDTVMILKDRSLTAIKPIRLYEDEFYAMRLSYINSVLPGNKFKVTKAKRGYLYFGTEQKSNGMPLRFMIDIEQAAEDSCILVFYKSK